MEWKGIIGHRQKRKHGEKQDFNAGHISHNKNHPLKVRVCLWVCSFAISCITTECRAVKINLLGPGFFFYF
jgi:hypothetical protein